MTTHADKWDGKARYEQPRVGDGIAVDDGRPVVRITDFAVCEPAGHLAQWELIDYATDDFEGTLLHLPKHRPGDALTLKLNVEGWYAVYVWLMGGDANVPNYAPDCDSVYAMSAGPALRLEGDADSSTRFATLSHNQMFWRGLEACFWRYADLTDQTLTIRHQGETIYLGAIELIPLSPPEVDAVEADRADRSHKRLIVKGDMYASNDSHYFREVIRHSDVRAWISGCNRTADLMDPNGSPSLRRMIADTRDLGIEAYACERPGLWSAYHTSNDPRYRDFNEHPDWHCLDRDGTHTHQASYAHPQVQDYMLARARAAAASGVDGFGYFFNRDPGLVLFEPVAMQGFEAKHGVDPTTLSDRDDRLLDWRADIITGYLRRVRQLLDDIAAEQQRDRIKMVHVVLGDEAANRFFSFDVARWVSEGLVDVLCPYPWADYPDRWLAQGYIDVDTAYFAKLCEGTACSVYPMWLTSVPGRYNWVQEHVRPREYFTKAMADYAAGADGISTWDAVGLALFHPFMASRWLRLGHKEQLADWADHDVPLPQKLRFTRYAGATPNRYPPGTGG